MDDLEPSTGEPDEEGHVTVTTVTEQPLWVHQPGGEEVWLRRHGSRWPSANLISYTSDNKHALVMIETRYLRRSEQRGWVERVCEECGRKLVPLWPMARIHPKYGAMMPLDCEIDEDIASANPKRRFCTDACRVRAYRKRRRNQQLQGEPPDA